MKLHATGKDLKIIESERLISGSRKIYSCEFTFDDSWDGYTVTAVFSTNSSRLVNMAIVDGVCEIPSEVLRPNARIRIGIFGIDGDRSRPTTYSDWVTVEQGTDTSGGAAQPPTPSVYEQWMNALDEKHDEWNEQEQARQDAEAARVEAEQAREDLETGYVARAESAAETAEAAAKVAEDAKDVIEDVMEGNFATKSYVDQQIAAIPTPDVSGQIGEHNTSKTAHADIREELENHTHTAVEVGARPATWMPTAADVGAVSKSGDTMTGHLMIKRSYPTMFLQNSVSNRESLVQLGDSDNRLVIVNRAANDTANKAYLSLAPETASAKELLKLYAVANGSSKIYDVYHTGNKPTAADVGAVPIDGSKSMTGNLMVQKASQPQVALHNTGASRYGYLRIADNGNMSFGSNPYGDGANATSLTLKTEGSAGESYGVISVTKNGTTAYRDILHTGNKPTGSYSGDGKTAKRTISTGGKGYVVFVWSSYSFGFVTPAGGMFYRTNGEYSFDSNSIRFSNTDGEGVLTIMGNSVHFNSSSYTYSYQVL